MSGLFKILFFLGDLLFLNLSILFSYLVWEGKFWVWDGTSGIYLSLFSSFSWLFLVVVSNPYEVTKSWSASKIINSQLSFLLIHLLVVASLIFFFQRSYDEILIALIYLFFIPVFFCWKVLIYYLRKVFSGETTVRNYVLIGNNEVSNEIRKHYLLNPQLGYRFKGYLNYEADNSLTEKIKQFCDGKEIHEIYCCIESVESSDMNYLINFGLDSLIKVKVVIRSSAKGESIHLDRFDNQPRIDVSVIPLDETINQIVKRLFDFTFSLLFMLLVMTWLVPLLFILIKIDSSGPLFFVQSRSGKDNKPFNCLKFRTMVVNVESNSRQATKDDPRITKLGHFLRKTSIDELPQFINVLIGNMSVVGPRPHMLKHTEEYAKLIDKFMGRHYVKPGITGLAQCLGYRGETKNLVDMENRVRMDRYYIEHWTFWLDVKIVFLTVVSLIRGSDKAF